MLATKIEESKREEGFTLIELLVVVIIIGILAAIAIPVFLNQRESAWRSSAESDARNAAIAMETAYTQLRSAYPLAVDGTFGMNNTDGTAPIWHVVDTTLPAQIAEPIANPVDVISEVAVSNGVGLQYTNQGTSYVITAYHAQIDGGTELVAQYNSALGGIVEGADVIDDAAVAGTGFPPPA